MNDSRILRRALVAGLAMLALILDSKTAFSGASEGISICLQAVIPSLFPFFFLSSILTGNLQGHIHPVFKPLNTLLGIPCGAESIWLTGILGGYPVGARCVSQAYQNGRLSRNEAGRMLGFCSNAGPAFVFGMTASCFPSLLYPCLLLLIQIISSLMTGILLPGKQYSKPYLAEKRLVTWHEAMHHAVQAMGNVCGWIILFRVILSFCERWFLWLLPSSLQVFLIGILELSNGILSLHRINSVPLRWILCSGMLSFGGICVIMQTQSVTGGLPILYYLRGKILQSLISTGLSAAFCCFLFSFDKVYLAVFAACFLSILLVHRLIHKKTVALSSHLMYNTRKKIDAR